MLKTIGFVVTFIGSILWEHGGFWKAESYEDLRVTGKLGYNLMCKGLDLAGYTLDDCNTLLSKY